MAPFPLFPPGTFADSRAMSDAGLAHRARVEARTTTTNAGGGDVEGWAVVAGLEAEPCWLSENGGGSEGVAAGQARAVAPFRVRFSPVRVAAVVTPRHRLVVTGTTADGAAFTRTVEITAVDAPGVLSAWFAYGEAVG